MNNYIINKIKNTYLIFHLRIYLLNELFKDFRNRNRYLSPFVLYLSQNSSY